MPLTLVLGPANSAKAGEVLGAYAAATPRGALLVVPTSVDAEHYARELARDGSLIGSVLTFSGLAREMARRAGFGATRVTDLQRERLLERAVGGARLQRLAEAAESRGFVRAAGGLIAELQRWLVTPARFAQALRTWAGPHAGRAAYAAELASLYSAYRRELERAGRVDEDLFSWRALDALREAPASWGGTPVFFYGFDDLQPLQRDAIETLAGPAGAEVTVSLTSESGRAALAARAETVEELRPLAARVVEMPPLDDYYGTAARAVLHHLERSLFAAGPGRVAAGEVVRLMEAGGERAEAELIAAEVIALRQAGMPAAEIAVVVRSLGRAAPVLERVFDQYGIPFSIDRDIPLAHTALGRGLLALARCLWQEPARTPVAELVAYLRASGVPERVELADRLEAAASWRGLRSLSELPRGRPLLDDPAGQASLTGLLEGLSTARASTDPAAELAAGARELLAGAGEGQAPRLGEAEARAYAAVLGALGELRAIDPDPAGAELIDLLERVTVPGGRPARQGAVLIADPLSIRARRFRAMIVAGLQEAEFPLAGAPEPFLSDELRGELAASSGLRLRPREDALARERYLFYACVSRATERLILSYRSSDEEGNLALPSPFLRDVADCLDEGWWERRRRRLLADVVWDPVGAPTERERLRALAATAPAPVPGAGAGGTAAPDRRLSPAALAHVRHREVVSAGALELYADCPVKWLIERQLEPRALEATPEALARGSFMHDTLESVLRGLGGPVTPESLPRALELLHRALRVLPEEVAAGRPAAVRAAARREIEADLSRYLEHEAADGCAYRPERLEQRFGFESEDSLPALELHGGGQPVHVRGAIDRIDVEPGGRRAIVRDYKSGSVRQEFQAGRWSADRRLQVPLYMLAVRELLGVEPVAGLYQPLRGGDLRPRGGYVAGSEPGACVYGTDALEPDEFEALLEDARTRATELAARLRRGELQACPSTCSRDGCRYPGICRSA